MKEFDRVSIIIPCYEPSEHNFVPYVKQLLETEINSIIIVNDGSGKKYKHVFEAICKLDEQRIHYIDYPENHGKGYALKTAYAYCKEHFFDDHVFVTADCDGQHLIKDVLNVALESMKNRGTLILGSRDFTLPCVPARSRTGNKNTSALMRFLYGINIEDTQTGLRGFSYSLLPILMSVSGDRFEYETDQLIRLHRADIAIREVPIDTVYEGKADDVEKVSHFNPIKDSMRVLGVLFRNLGWYFISSVISAVLDVVIFALMFGFVLKMPSLTLRTLVATVTARTLSSIVNFTFNYKLAFEGKSKRSIIRYYILWFFQLGASFGLARMWAGLTDSEAAVSLLKGVSDIVLALLSYQIQSRWVFANKTPPRHFYGSFMGFAKSVFRAFSKKYDASEITYPDEGRVYVCRHLDMHGVYTVMKSLDFDVHIMAYHVFFTFKGAYKQYSEITFAKNGKTTFGSRVKGFFLSLIVPSLLKSARAVPVYRNSIHSYKTIREAGKHLKSKECVVVFPDIDYKAHEGQDSDIYNGFLLLEKIYLREVGAHLKFVPLYISEHDKTICEHRSVMFRDGDFRSQLDEVTEEIRISIHNKVK